MRYRDYQRMSNNERKALKPNLRFQEFHGKESWQLKKLNEFSNVVASGDLDKNLFLETPDDQHTYPIYSNSVSEEGLYGYYKTAKYKKGSVTITARGTLGVAFTRYQDFMGIGRLLVVSDFQNVVPNFFTESWNHTVKLALENGGIPQLTAIKARPVELYIPPMEEQKKIDGCLSSLEKVITLQVEKLGLLQSHRKGLMQQLFPVGEEEAPSFRFPDFLNKQSWRKLEFSKLFKIGGGKDHKHLSSGNIPVYGSGGYMRSANEYLYDGESACIGRKGTINKPIFLTGKFWTVDTLFYTHSFKDCLPKFIFLLFQNINWLALNEAGGVPSLSKIIISKVEVMVPDIDEQQKIVNCIFSLDEIIEQQKKKIVALKKHKRGLMQQLFPSAENL